MDFKAQRVMVTFTKVEADAIIKYSEARGWKLGTTVRQLALEKLAEESGIDVNETRLFGR